jgi:3-oxoadipate enol-lactonase
MAATTTSANGATVAYESVGQGDPVVFVHAFPFNHQMWQMQVRALREDYQVITVDLPGFGASGAVAQPSMASFAGAVLAALDAAQVDRPAVFVGLSMGGYVLFELVRQAPERIRALVLADTRAPADTAEGRENRLRQAAQVRERGAVVVTEAMLPKMLTEAGHQTLLLADQVKSWMEAAPPAGIVGALEAMAARPDSTGTLAEIGVPTLVMVGEADPITTRADAEAMVAKIAGAELELIAGAAHLSNVEQPEAFNAAVRRFLDELEPTLRDEEGYPHLPEGTTRTEDRG